MSQDHRAFDEIVSTFALLDDWDERYRYLIELGRRLEPLSEDARTAENKVQGCTSQVWLHTIKKGNRLHFTGDSDAHLVKGLIAVLIAFYSNRTASEILSMNANAVFENLGLEHHISPQRSNGLQSMVKRIRGEAKKAIPSD